MVTRALRHALRGIDAPCAVLDIEAFDANLESLASRADGLPVRLASKSLRVPAAIDRALSHPAFRGLLSFSLPEALLLHERGADDVVRSSAAAGPTGSSAAETTEPRHLSVTGFRAAGPARAPSAPCGDPRISAWSTAGPCGPS
ncbi:hypothetical protein [Brachybacterium endophyticum]|uniref:hypothetical protein n=1 Tax=Brachybacterium endophyticum TaxID=2182385 RepID=UPI001057DCE1|nr:hypothetical protein [Brachybacterium endophyticum]